MGVPEGNVHLYLIDDSGTVSMLSTVVDSVNHTATANIPHLSQIVLAAPVSVQSLPVVNGGTVANAP